MNQNKTLHQYQTRKSIIIHFYTLLKYDDEMKTKQNIMRLVINALFWLLS